MLALEDVPRDLYRKMYKLNLGYRNSLRYGEDWRMVTELVNARHNHVPSFVHYIVDDLGKLVAWALTFKSEKYEPVVLEVGWCSYFYTRKKYRCEGLGSKLYEAARDFIWEQYGEIIHVFPHDKTSHSFFKKNGRA